MNLIDRFNRLDTQAHLQRLEKDFSVMLTGFTDGKHAITSMLAKHLDNHKTAHQDWPADAVYCVEYRVKAWPTDFTRNAQFFNCAIDLSKWYNTMIYWALLEDNHFELDKLWMWDLGPQLLDDITPHINATK